MARIKGSIPAKSAEIRGAPTKKAGHTHTPQQNHTRVGLGADTSDIIGGAAGLLSPVLRRSAH